MEFQNELNELKVIQKQALRNYITLVSQYNDYWTEWFDVCHKIKLIRARQKLRQEQGFSPNQHPQNKPGFHSMNQNAQFEERQLFEKQQFEHQTDEQSINTLSQQANQFRERGKIRLDWMDESLGVFEQLSQTANGFINQEKSQEETVE